MVRTTPGGMTRNEGISDVARDARDALATIEGFAEILEEDFAEHNPGAAADLQKIRQAAAKVMEFVAYLEAQADSARELAGRDPLTGIPNRRTLMARAAAFLREERPLSVLVIDVDRFKYVNDHYGHLAGDEVLMILVERCRRAVRESDVVARFAGDEFVILLPGASEPEANRVAERILEHVTESPFPTERGEIPIGVSIGVATRGEGETSLEALLEAADHAMYRTKQARGRR